jgi:hypothetical protein
MSLDVVLYKFSEYPLAIDTDISGLEHVPLGTVAEVRDLISTQLPDTEWEAYWTGYCLGKNYRFEFFVGSFDSDEDDLIDHLDVTVYGQLGEAAINALLMLAIPNQWTIQEVVDGKFILPEMFDSTPSG